MQTDSFNTVKRFVPRTRPIRRQTDPKKDVNYKMFICVRILLSFLNHFGLRTYKGQENHQVILTYGRPRMSKKPNPSNQIYHEETDRRISKMTFRLSHLFEISYRCNLYDSIFDLFTFRSCIIADEYFRSLLKLLDTTSILF